MNEVAVIQAAQKGDAEAFGRLLSQYYDTIFRFALKWCGNRHDAEDIAQQVCIKLARVLKQFRFESAFSSWLYRIVINAAKDFQMKERRHVSASSDELTESEKGSEEALVLLHQLVQKVDTWGDGFKESMLLVHGEGLTHAEAASILGVKESTISWRLHEIRKKLSLLKNA